MPYKVRVSHINQDFSLDTPPEKAWSEFYEDRHELVLLLNRIAIATSQGGVADPPLVEIIYANKLITVEAIDGFLYYTDPASSNRRNLKVIGDEVVPLIHGQDVEFVLSKSDDDDDLAHGQSVRYRGGAGNSSAFKWALLACLFGVIAVCSYVIYGTLTHKVRLVPAPEFIPHNFGAKSLLPKLEGVYVSEFRDGGYVCDIQKNGDFGLYELWHLDGREGFVLVLVESLKLHEGLHYDLPVLLAGEYRLIRPINNGNIAMQGIVMEPQSKQLEEIGEILERAK